MQAESAQNPAEEVPEQGDHGILPKTANRVCRQILILRLHRVLTNNSRVFTQYDYGIMTMLKEP